MRTTWADLKGVNGQGSMNSSLSSSTRQSLAGWSNGAGSCCHQSAEFCLSPHWFELLQSIRTPLHFALALQTQLLQMKDLIYFQTVPYAYAMFDSTYNWSSINGIWPNEYKPHSIHTGMLIQTRRIIRDLTEVWFFSNLLRQKESGFLFTSISIMCFWLMFVWPIFLIRICVSSWVVCSSVLRICFLIWAIWRYLVQFYSEQPCNLSWWCFGLHDDLGVWFWSSRRQAEGALNLWLIKCQPSSVSNIPGGWMFWWLIAAGFGSQHTFFCIGAAVLID